VQSRNHLTNHQKCGTADLKALVPLGNGTIVDRRRSWSLPPLSLNGKGVAILSATSLTWSQASPKRRRRPSRTGNESYRGHHWRSRSTHNEGKSPVGVKVKLITVSGLGKEGNQG
jgi:hypothetical protein